MAKRVTVIDTNVEYVPAQMMRVTAIDANVEYIPPQVMRVTAISIMVEYIPGAAVTGRVYGPAVQMMG